jgi:hypothetical protein
MAGAKNFCPSASGHSGNLYCVHPRQQVWPGRQQRLPSLRQTLGLSLLAIVGSAEPKFFYEYAQEIVAGAAPRGTCILVEGADHFYNRHTPEIVEMLLGGSAQWPISRQRLGDRRRKY